MHIFITLVTLLLFGFIGYSIAKGRGSSASGWLDAALVVLLVIAANTHGVGYFRAFEYTMHINEILEGMIAGYLIRRLIAR